MAISFNEIPILIRTPGVYTEFDNSRAVQGVSAQPQKALVVGQVKTSGTGTKAVNTLVAIPSGPASETYFGVGSQIAEMCKAFKNADPYTELWAIALDDDGAGVAAAGSIVFSGTATEDGTYNAYIGGHKLSVVVTSGDVHTVLGTALDAASDAVAEIPMVGVDTAGTVAFTCRWKGPSGNLIDIRENYYQTQKTPAGITTVITQPSAGANAPDYDDAVTAIADEQFNTIVVGTNDATELGKITDLLDTRWGPMDQKDGHCFSANDDTAGSLTTYGNTLNNEHLTVVGTYNMPTPFYVLASVAGAVDAYQTGIDPSRPRQGLELNGIMAPDEASRFIRSERNTLLTDGIATVTFDASGKCHVERLITTYQTNSLSVADTSYLDITTMRNLSWLRYSLNVWIGLRFPRHKLVDDATEYGDGVPVVDPAGIHTEVLAWYRAQIDLAHVENFDTFKAALLVERSTTDTERANAIIPPDLINGFRVMANQIQFQL